MLLKVDRLNRASKNRRNYYADYKNHPKTSASVKNNSGIVSLLAYVPKKAIGQNWLSHWFGSSFSALWNKFFGKHWQELLVFSNNQISPNLEDNIDWTWTIEKRIDYILADLYSIPDPVWQQFVISLDSELVAALNLEKHRHLWEAYNFAQSKPNWTEQLATAKLLGKHHFLLSMLKMSNTNLLSILSKKRRFTQPEMITLESNLLQFTNEIERGVFNYELMQSIHPAFKPQFLHKMSHCVKFSEVVSLADAVLYYSSTPPNYILSHYLFSPTLKSDLSIKATNWLYDSNKQPKEFAKSIALALKLNDYPGLFFGSRKKLLDYETNYIASIKLSDNKDYLRCLFEDLVVPQILQQCHEKQVSLEHCIKRVRHLFEKMITESLSLDKMEKLSKRWHRNFFHIEAIKPVVKNQSWEPLINNLVINGLIISAITNPERLREHGKEMRHCVGGYSDNCLKNISNILEFLDTNNVKSTLELGYVAQNQLIILQHRSYQNSEPAPHHLYTAKLLVAKLNSGEIAVNPKRLLEEPKLVELLSFDFRDLAMVERIYQAYKINKILPAKLMATTYQELLEKTKLIEYIDETIEKMPPDPGKLYLVRQYEYEIKAGF